MPFGLTNAPAVFQALVNDVLRDFLNIFVVVYLDDILVFSKTATEHSRHIRQVLQRLLENRLFVKAEKCVFSSPLDTFWRRGVFGRTRGRLRRWKSGRVATPY